MEEKPDLSKVKVEITDCEYEDNGNPDVGFDTVMIKIERNDSPDRDNNKLSINSSVYDNEETEKKIKKDNEKYTTTNRNNIIEFVTIKCEQISTNTQEASVTETPDQPTRKNTGEINYNSALNRVKCSVCERTFKNKMNLGQHMRYVHASKDCVVECSQCCKLFRTKAHLRCHINSVHAEEKIVKCKFCNKTYSTPKKLSNHIFYAHPQPGESVPCDICKKIFKSKYNLKVHIRQVHPSENQSVICNYCNKEFKTDSLLQRHIKWSHPSDGLLYKCEMCGRTLPSIECYKKHVKNVHSSKQLLSCDTCGKTFKTKQTLVRHLKFVHGNLKQPIKKNICGNVPCSKCDKKFATNTALFWHFERCHTGNKANNACHICAKELCDSASLKRHLEMVHSLETATCDLCQKVFKSPKNLERHIKVTHARPDQAIDCEICKKTFKCPMHLRVHMHIVHSKDGPAKCDICKKEFASRIYMEKHKKLHVTSKEFPCQVCGKLYKTTGHVRKHWKRIHAGTIHVETTGHIVDERRNIRDEANERKCLKCGSGFASDDELHLHILKCGTDIPLLVVKAELEDEDT